MTAIAMIIGIIFVFSLFSCLNTFFHSSFSRVLKSSEKSVCCPFSSFFPFIFLNTIGAVIKAIIIRVMIMYCPYLFHVLYAVSYCLFL